MKWNTLFWCRQCGKFGKVLLPGVCTVSVWLWIFYISIPLFGTKFLKFVSTLLWWRSHTHIYRYKKRQTVSDCMILLPSFCGAWWYIWMKAILWRTLTWINFYSVRQPNCGNVTVRFVHHKSFMALKWVAWKNLTIYRWKNNDSIVVVFWEKILFWCSASVWPNLTKYEFWAAENLNFKDLMPSSFFWLWNLKVSHSCIQFPHKI